VSFDSYLICETSLVRLLIDAFFPVFTLFVSTGVTYV